MPRLSAGLLLYRVDDRPIEVLLVHPGGPFWATRDDGAWSIPKGEYVLGEDPWLVAQREFTEETGLVAPAGPPVGLGEVRQPGGKIVTAFAVLGNLDVTDAHSNTFEMEWPKGSGRIRSFPEVDKAGWFSLPHARTKILRGQVPFLDRLVTRG